jgi:CubicO group peptidase (beta-lactamase class C family)
MDDTGFWVPENKQNRFAGLYFADKEGKLILAGDTLGAQFKKNPILFSGGGGLVSTIEDYSRFCRMLLHKGELDGIRILKESTVNLIMSNQLPAGVMYKEGRGYGLGGEVNLETDVYAWSGAASTFFWVNPKTKMIVMAFMQLMPFTTAYAIPYKQIVDRALIKPDQKE